MLRMKNKNIIEKRTKNLEGLISAQLQGLAVYLPALFTFLSVNPAWVLAFTGAASLYAVYMAYNQDDINHLIKFINEHPEEFSKKIIQTKEFEKGFVIFIEKYLKERIETKKEILKKILLGYAHSENKPKYELERLNDSVSRISLPTLEFLEFFLREIMPKINEKVLEEATRMVATHPDRSLEWWVELLITQKTILVDFINKWTHDNYSPSIEKVKKEYGISNNEGWIPHLEHRAQTRERSVQAEHNAAMTELVTLGIFDIKIEASYNASSKEYSITRFGLKFLKYILE